MPGPSSRIDILFTRPRDGNIENDPSPGAPLQEGRGGPDGENPPPGPGYPLLVVRAGDFRAGIPVGRVREVLRLRRLARFPGGRSPFRGLLSLRGEIVTVVELVALQAAAVAEAAGAGPATHDTTGVTTGSIRPTRIDSVVVLRGGHDALGLEVDGVEDIRNFEAGTADRPTEPIPEVAGAPERTAPGAPAPGRMWAGVVKDERGEIGVLDADAVFEMVEAMATQTEEPEALEVGDSGQGT
jgi:chemotaxis signal transduction protein